MIQVLERAGPWALSRLSRRSRLASLCLVLASNAPAAVAADGGGVLSLEDAIARAEEASGLVRRARAERQVVAARDVGASLLLPANPVLAGSAGPRHEDDPGGRLQGTSYALRLEQALEVAGQRVNQLLAGSRADVVIKVFGEDLAVLKETADRIGAVVNTVPGRGDLRVQRVLGLPLLEVIPDRARLARYGISADHVLEVVEASRVGRFAGKIFEGSRRFDLMLLLPPATLTPDAFGELLVGSENGTLVPMASVATIQETEGPAVINRESLQRRVLVEANVRGRDLVSFVNEARRRVAAEVSLPEGVTVEWGGQFENFTRASARLAVVVPIALGLIFTMLFLMFGDLRSAVAVFAGAPFAIVGGVVSLALRHLPFSIPAAVGFIAVAGVAVLNGVVMTSEVHVYLQRGQLGLDVIRRSALTVLRPVLTTALVAAVGFIPMAVSTSAGAEVQRPLATVVIGGIVSSTLLGLTVLPVLLRLLLKPEEAPVEPARVPTATVER